MAEAIGLFAGIVAIVQIADRVIGLCKFYIETGHDAPSDLRSILLEISTLKAILENVVPLVSSSGEETSIMMRFSGPHNPIQACHSIMTKMEALFPSSYHQAQDNTSKRQKVKASLATLAWPLFKAERAKKLVGDLSNVKVTISLALTVQTTFSYEAREIKGRARAIHAIVSDAQRDKIYKWLQITDPTPLHHRACSQYEPKTGDWMLRSHEWTNWLRATTRCVWIHGIPGAGKTILASHLIGAIKDHLKAVTLEKHGFVYYYCSFTNNQNEVAPFLRWTINKLCRQAKSIPTCLDELYEQGGTPSVEDLLSIIEAIIVDFDKVYIVIDAIDESLEPRDELLEALQMLASDPRFERIKLLATSREYNGIKKIMEPISAPISMMNTLLSEDIRLYTQSKLNNTHKFKHWPSNLLAEVLETLSTNAKGMFRWVVCQIYILERLKPEYDIVTYALANLPKTLDDTYERIFQAVHEEDRLVVQFALKWIFYHQHLYKRNISMPILLEAIERSISKMTASKHHYFLDEDRLRDICGCLITVTPQSSHFSRDLDTVSFAHFTVWEFVSSIRMVNPSAKFFSVREESTRGELTRFLICETLNNKADKLLRDSDKDTEMRLDQPNYWFTEIDRITRIKLDEHFDVFCTLSSVYSLRVMGREALEQEDLRRLAFDLLDHSKAHFTSIYQVALAIYEPFDMNPGEVDNFLCDLLSIMWPSSSKNTTASLLAELLIIDTSFELAEKFMEQSDEQMLLQIQLEFHKIHLNLGGSEKESYLFRGSIVELFTQLSGVFRKQFRFLLQRGACVIDPSMVLYSYLGAYAGSYKPAKDALPQILQLVADVNSSRFIVSPLQIATQTSNLEAVKALLAAGADPNYKGNVDGLSWECGTLLFQFNGLVGICPLDICLHLLTRDNLQELRDRDSDRDRDRDEIRSLLSRKD